MLSFSEHFNNILYEKLSLKGNYKGGVYQRLVAANYVLAESFDLKAIPAFNDLIKKFSRQYDFVSSKFEFDPVHKDPYTSMKHLVKSIDDQKKSGKKKPKVSVFAELPGPEGNYEKQGHPLFDNDFNVKLRWVHDIIAHYYGKHPFSARGEYAAYNRHLKTLGPNTPAAGALFTEVVGQTSCYYVYGDYIEQKVVILDDFDFVNVGQLNPSSKLNNFFEIREKTMYPKADFNVEIFSNQFPELYDELKKQEALDKSLAALQPIFL